jgi:ribosomal protein S18 acetylase RimI-like enzyme
MVTIRQATAADAPGIARVHVDTWRSTYQGIVPQAFLDSLDLEARTKQWEEWLVREGVRVFVAEDAGAVCGFISGGTLHDKVHVAALKYDSEIYTLYVLAAAQGRGAGRELMSALAHRLVQDGLMRPVVWALEENPWCAFYERLGGKRVAQKMIEIGGTQLSDIAYGWEEIGALLERRV